MEVKITDTPQGQHLEMGEGFDELPPVQRVDLQLRIARVGAQLIGEKLPLAIRFTPLAQAKRTPEERAGEA